MNHTRTRRKKGIVGIEAAIVLIAFVIVAAALAFVSLNMGLFTTQKSKEVISRGLGEASSALEVDGSVTGLTDGSKVIAASIPVKVAPGRQAVDLGTDKTTIRLIVGNSAFENVHQTVYYYNGTHLVDAANPASAVSVSDLEISTLVSSVWSSPPTTPEAVFVIIKNVNEDGVLEYGEKSILLINVNNTYALDPYEQMKVEIRPPEGSPLTVERSMPATLPSTGGAIDLG